MVCAAQSDPDYGEKAMRPQRKLKAKNKEKERERKKKLLQCDISDLIYRYFPKGAPGFAEGKIFLLDRDLSRHQ